MAGALGLSAKSIPPHVMVEARRFLLASHHGAKTRPHFDALVEQLIQHNMQVSELEGARK